METNVLSKLTAVKSCLDEFCGLDLDGIGSQIGLICHGSVQLDGSTCLLLQEQLVGIDPDVLCGLITCIKGLVPILDRCCCSIECSA